MDSKEQAGRKAAEYVKNGMVVGLGTGTTAEWAIRALADRVKRGDVKDIQCIPTSTSTRRLADEMGLSIRGLEDVEWVDLTIDGADQVDDKLNLIKGRGGALLREKVVAFSSGEVIIVVDESKRAAGGRVPGSGRSHSVRGGGRSASAHQLGRLGGTAHGWR